MSMVNSLLRREELVGQSRARLESLLGPDEESHLDAWSLFYRLADRPGFLSDGGRGLTIFLDEEDVAYAIEMRN